MSAQAHTLTFEPKVICFRCRQSGCNCVARHNRAIVAEGARGSSLPDLGSVKAWVVAMSGACLAGGAVGALVALWM